MAPLYCDEPMKLCGREKSNLRTTDGHIYEVWIEGPTGGMAVKGTVRTACNLEESPEPREHKRVLLKSVPRTADAEQKNKAVEIREKQKAKQIGRAHV